jgi:rhodanese-related sulfurtransferase
VLQKTTKMISIFKRMMGGASSDLSGLLKEGAVVVDVRTRDEFRMGHAKGSINIPLDRIEDEAAKLSKHPHVIVCCRSGSRSAYAMQLLKGEGLTNVTNGGSWQNVSEAMKGST